MEEIINISLKIPLESFMGALYLDTNDFLIVQEFIINLIEEFLDIPQIVMTDTNYKDQILRYFGHNFKRCPKYEHIIKEENDIEFQCKLLHNTCLISIGKGQTKKKAEQNAAYNALIHYNVITE